MKARLRVRDGWLEQAEVEPPTPACRFLVSAEPSYNAS